MCRKFNYTLQSARGPIPRGEEKIEKLKKRGENRKTEKEREKKTEDSKLKLGSTPIRGKVEAVPHCTPNRSPKDTAPAVDHRRSS